MLFRSHARPNDVQGLCDKGIVPIEHDLDEGNDIDLPHIMGQVAGSVKKVQPAAEIVYDMVQEATDMLKKASGFFSAQSKL